MKGFPRLPCLEIAICALIVARAAGAQAPAKTIARVSGVAEPRSQLSGLPPLEPPRPLSFPSVTQFVLPNGIHVILLEDHRQPAIFLGFGTPAGTGLDPAGKAGLASITAELLQVGPVSQPPDQMSNRVDALGASLSVSTYEDYTLVSLSGLSKYSEKLCEILSDITTRPKFDDTDVEGEKGGYLSVLGTDLSDPGTLASAALSRVVYGKHPYGNYARGTAETVSGLTAADIRSFYAANYSPKTSTLLLLGDLSAARARELSLKCFAGWAPTSSPAKAPAEAAREVWTTAPETRPAITILDRPGAEQTEIRIGARVSGRTEANRYAEMLATAVLGDGQLDSRLTREIRIKRGLTYDVSATFDVNRDAGIFSISTATKTASTGEVIRLALEEVRKLAATPPPVTELNDRKTLIAGNFAVSAASPSFFLGLLLEGVIYGDSPAYAERFIPAINSVTPAQIAKAMSDLHIEGAKIVLVGDAKAILPQLGQLGTVIIIEPADLDLMSPTLKRASAPQGATPAPVAAVPRP